MVRIFAFYVVVLALVQPPSENTTLAQPLQSAATAPSGEEPKQVESSRRFSLEIRAGKLSFEPDEPIILHLVLRAGSEGLGLNVGPQDSWVLSGRVLTPGGGFASVRSDAYKVLKDGSSGPKSLHPGQQIEIDFPINGAYEMAAAGTYSVRMSVQIWTPEGPVFVPLRDRLWLNSNSI